MKKLYSFFFVLLMAGLSAKAQFSASYAPSKWTKTLTTGFVNTASVNATAAPASLQAHGALTGLIEPMMQMQILDGILQAYW
jgi:hypothetical protein